MADVYIYSTLSNDQKYAVDGGKEIHIAGRANVADKKNIHTPKGVVTTVDESTFDLLQRNIIFAAHSKNGFISAEHRKADAEKVAKDLAGKDKSAQETEESLKPKTNAKKSKDE